MWLSRLSIIVMLGLLAGCSGVSIAPLGKSIAGDNHPIAIVEASGRNGQIYSRALRRLLGHADEPLFTLSSTLSVSSSSTLTVRGSSSNLKNRSMTVSISLVENATGKQVMSDSITGRSTVGTVSSYYAQTQSDKHADERTSLLLAERVATRVHLYFLDAERQ